MNRGRLAYWTSFAEIISAVAIVISLLRYLAYQHVFFDSWEVAWLYHEDGILDHPTWQEWDGWFTQEARSRPEFGWTENQRHFTGKSFRQHVDSSLNPN